MSESLTFLKLSQINQLRCATVYHPINDWSPTDWACAMAGECGEACNEVKKLRRLDGAHGAMVSAERQNTIQRIAKELADTIIYADLLATRLGIDLERTIREKFNEVSDRMDSEIKL